MNRTTFLRMSAGALSLWPSCGEPGGASALGPPEAFSQLERTTGGRLGVFASDFGGRSPLAYRPDERFPMCSTFKVLAISAVLRRIDRGEERLDREIPYDKSDLLAYAPVTTANVAHGRMTVEALCVAAIELSDNTAANLLLKTLGGPLAVTSMVRAAPFQDPVTRLDRTEPTLSTSIPGDPRDTTSPRAMAALVRGLLLAPGALSPQSARRLEGWMRACQTGLDALRAGFPGSWVAGDKTGSGDRGTRNDVAVVRRPGSSPLVVVAYLTGATAISNDRRNAALKSVGTIVAAAFR